ncbi:MAG: hypothetical protein MI892_16495, partial [Desulfobacterales bacterium]|nr:hypothetical protein [Desulfobacterales bacterium]
YGYGGCLRSVRSYIHGGAGGVTVFIDPDYDLLYVLFTIVRKNEWKRGLFANIVTGSVREL